MAFVPIFGSWWSVLLMPNAFGSIPIFGLKVSVWRCAPCVMARVWCLPLILAPSIALAVVTASSTSDVLASLASSLACVQAFHALGMTIRNGWCASRRAAGSWVNAANGQRSGHPLGVRPACCIDAAGRQPLMLGPCPVGLFVARFLRPQLFSLVLNCGTHTFSERRSVEKPLS